MSFSIETIKEYTGAGFKCALFDFDGTISLIREGWQKVMVPYFCEVIEALGTGESEDGIREEVTEFVDRLTGKQTIFQCIALDEAVVRRGGEHVDPGEYKKEYLRRLEIGIASWNAPPEKVLIYAGFRGFENEKIFEFSPSVLPIFQSGLGEDTTWRVVRVVEGATLEKSCAARHLGFESLTLRQPEKPVLPASLFYSRFPIPKPASIASAEITFELYSRCA